MSNTNDHAPTPTNITNIRDADILEEEIVTVEHGDVVGNCKWFNKKLGYGFITVYSGEKKGNNIFVHHSGIKPLNSHFKTLRKGEYVHFNIIDGQNGLQAIDVTGVCGGPLMCDNVEVRSIPHRRPMNNA
jgi:cold shock protein